jgi:hypothetical protein
MMVPMDHSAPELRLPKIPVEIEIAVVGGAIRTVRVFVAQHQEHDYRRQHLIDLLEAPKPFLATQPADGEPFELANKATVVWAALALDDGALPIEEEADDREPELYDVQTQVRVDLVGLESLAGQVLYSPPSGRARVYDYLNQGGRFFRLWTADKLYLVNKDHTLRVVELDPAA